MCSEVLEILAGLTGIPVSVIDTLVFWGYIQVPRTYQIKQ
jgi:hypothetical protein